MDPLSLSRRLLSLSVAGMSVSGLSAVLIGFAGDWHWFADLFAHLRPQYCVWLALAALGAVVVKHRAALWIAVIGLLANAVALAPYAMPWRDEGHGRTIGRTWTIASVNLLYGNLDVERVTGYLRRTQPDIVVFQEVSSHWSADLEVLSDLYPYRSTQSAKNQFGLAVFSRDKPVDVTIQATGDREGNRMVFGIWESEGRRFGLAGIHPDKPDEKWKTENRRAYFAQLTRWCSERARADESVVVIGDFNATPWSSSMKSFTRDTGLRNTSQGTIFGATWNVWQPHRLQIDHALVSSHWALLDREVGPAIGSDHRPLLIRAALRPN